MSYDLHFRKKNKSVFSLPEFKEYFESRPNYQLQNGQAVYQNAATGVYFIMEHNVVDSSSDESEGDVPSVTFNLNYVRPHIFALEAEPEVRKFVNTFDLLVDDYQDNGHTTDVYDTDSFLRGWNVGNKFACVAIAKSNPDIAKRVFPRSEIEKNWKWNFSKDKFQEQLGEDIFVPTISYQEIEGKIKSLIVWSDAIPTSFPDVDTVGVFRHGLAPSSFFSKQKDDFTSLDFAQIKNLLGEPISTETGLKYMSLVSEQAAKEMVRSLPQSSLRPTVIPIDHILDAELFA